MSIQPEGPRPPPSAVFRPELCCPGPVTERKAPVGMAVPWGVRASITHPNRILFRRSCTLLLDFGTGGVRRLNRRSVAPRCWHRWCRSRSVALRCCRCLNRRSVAQRYWHRWCCSRCPRSGSGCMLSGNGSPFVPQVRVRSRVDLERRPASDENSNPDHGPCTARVTSIGKRRRSW